MNHEDDLIDMVEAAMRVVSSQRGMLLNLKKQLKGRLQHQEGFTPPSHKPLLLKIAELERLLDDKQFGSTVLYEVTCTGARIFDDPGLKDLRRDEKFRIVVLNPLPEELSR